MATSAGPGADFMDLGVRQWETPHVAAWVQSIPVKQAVKEAVVRAVREQELDGEGLLDVDEEEVAEEWGLSPMQAGIFLRKVQAARVEYRGFDAEAVETTDAPGVFSYGDEGAPRARMPCGHGITASGMYLVMQSELARPVAVDIVCPQPKCSRVWPWPLCCKVAGLDGDESLAMSKQYMAKRMKECPWCKAFIVRPDSVSQKRVACPCGGADFCFDCLVKWQWPGLQLCRAAGCSSNQKNQILANCSWKAPKYIDDAKQMPSIRACPKCETLIEHTEACKHMNCPACQTDFCFVCLQLRAASGTWPCGSHTDQCPVAPVQFLEA